MIFSCCNDNRKNSVRASTKLNGIDFLEVADSGATLNVHFLNSNSLSTLTKDNVVIEGGESITSFNVQKVEMASNSQTIVAVTLDRMGDFSRYDLRLRHSGATSALPILQVPNWVDPLLGQVSFSFRSQCGTLDCAPPAVTCPQPVPVPPPINYLAKDYGSFRSIMLDRISQLIPSWGGPATEADFGVVLTELVSYVADQLSYQQDAIATEAYLETARSRVSLRRHAVLVDYHVHDGCNARTWMQINVAGKPGDAVFLDHTQARFFTVVPGMPSNLNVSPNNANEEAAIASGVQVFEPLFDALLYPENNMMHFYTWGNKNCCLPQGATQATLRGCFGNLKVGDVLIFQEEKGPLSGAAADADIRHRCAVMLTDVEPITDPLLTNECGQPIPLTQIQWSSDDALPFPLCISTPQADCVSVAYGNVVLADHGLSMTNIKIGKVPAPRLNFAPTPSPDRCTSPKLVQLPVRFRTTVPDSPVTQAVPVPSAASTASGNPMTTGYLYPDTSGVYHLTSSQNFPCMTLQAADVINWPSLFSVLARPNASNPSNIDLLVVFNPSGVARTQSWTPVETLLNLSLTGSSTQDLRSHINTHFRLIQVQSVYASHAAGSPGFAAAPTPLQPTQATVTLLDVQGNTVLTLSATDPTGQTAGSTSWPSLFPVTAQPSPGNPATEFNLNVFYRPPQGASAVALEAFNNLTLGEAAGQIDSASALLQVASIAQSLNTAESASSSATSLMSFDAVDALPSILLHGTVYGMTQDWAPQQSLLASSETATHFVMEVEADGTAQLRFGDNTNGKSPDKHTKLLADYRVGNGTAGNVGAESLVMMSGVNALSCRNPLPATGGTDPETNDQIRRRAPQAFLTTQERAVTMADYETEAETNPQVDQAVATLRWTGSWYTVFVTVEPKGGGNPDPLLVSSLETDLDGKRMAGLEVSVKPPQYVSLEIALQVCVNPNYFQSDVQRALLEVLGNTLLPDGRKGVFYPDNFTFGQTVYLSKVYAAALSVAGVVSVTATTFQPQGTTDPQYLDAGEIQLGPLQIARLDNDPSLPDHGQLTLNMEGGK